MSATNMQIAWALSEDKTKVIILITDNGTPVGHIILDTPELEQMIQGLADTRVKMAEPVMNDLDPGTRMLATVSPNWQARPPPDRQGALLIVRHPGFGWLANLLIPAEAQALGQALLNLSVLRSPDTPPPPSSTPE